MAEYIINTLVFLLGIVYNSITESVSFFNIISWYGNLRVKEKSKLNQTVKKACKVTGKYQKFILEIHRNFTKKSTKKKQC